MQGAGLIRNVCGSDRHAELMRDALPSSLLLLATLKRDDEITLPERHLGLVQADEVKDELEIRFEAAVEWLQETQDTGLLSLPYAVAFDPANQVDAEQTIEQHLLGKTIAVAKDAAFSFIYYANLIALKSLGAELVFFSPLHDQALPKADALWLPGGYPELRSKTLSENTALRHAIPDFNQAGTCVLAEGVGMLYRLEPLSE